MAPSMTTEPPVHIVRQLLEAQLAHDKAMRRLEDAGVDLNKEVYVDITDIIADWYGIPKDNTVETHAMDRAMQTGDWPEDAYCRDWLLDEWGKVQEQNATIDDFIAILQKEPKP